MNRAAQIGPSRFGWWPKWQGETVAVIACGPSLRNVDVSLLRGRMRVIAIKEAAYQLCPWADAVYGCDLPWWAHRRGMPEFKGLKLGFEPSIRDRFPDVNLVTIRQEPNVRGRKYVKHMLFDEPAEIGGGGNSGFQVLNLVVQFGAARIPLLGFDMAMAGGAHFYGRNNWPKARNPDEVFLRNCLEPFEKASALLASMGIEVVNCSPVSALKGFRKASLDQVLKEWGV
jgi:hypothetical protein